MYFHAKHDFGVGNTIMCTPALQAYYQQTGKKVKAKFDLPYVKQLFNNADFIEIVEKIPYVDAHSGMINQDKPDYEYFWEIIKAKFNLESQELPHTYVDHSKKTKIDENKVVLVRGCGNINKWHLKDPGASVYNKIVNFLTKKGFECVFVGSEGDKKHNRSVLKETKAQNKYGDILLAISEIEKAKFVVMNDTGLYHAAGAMNKKGFIMWKDTNFIKNMSPNSNFIFSFQDYYVDFIENYYRLC